MLEGIKLKREHHQELKEYAEQKGLMFISTPFSIDDIDYLFSLGVLVFKVGSSDANNTPYLSHMAQKALPIILSTGMCTLEEVQYSVATIRAAGNENIVVLHCTTNYPAQKDEVNLRAMATLQKELGVPCGYSDHTSGIEVPIAVTALGAVAIEKHFTLDRSMPGPDHKASLEPDELMAMVNSIRNIEQAMGSFEKKPTFNELEIAPIARKSLVAARLMSSGTILEVRDITVKRPGTGISPPNFDKVIGKKTIKEIGEDELIRWEDLE